MADQKLFNGRPALIGTFPLDIDEMMFYLYLPIKMKGDVHWKIPPRLKVFKTLIIESIKDLIETKGHQHFQDNYIYISAKNLFVTPDNVGGRPGYHIDGFMTDDLSYIWCDKAPTIFNSGDFILTLDHAQSMIEMELQTRKEKEYTMNNFDLLRIDNTVVHRTPDIAKPGMRCFFKLNVSKEKYNLKGNSHNYEFEYDWNLHDRSEVRNEPATANLDAIIER